MTNLSRNGPGRGTTFTLSKKPPTPKTKDTGSKVQKDLDRWNLFNDGLKEYGELLRIRKVHYKSRTTKYELIGESAFDALYLARGYIEVLADSVPKFLTLPMKDQMVFYLIARDWPQDKFIKYAKYCTAYPMAKFLNNPLPDVPEGFKGNPLFIGKVKRLLKSRLVSKTDRNARLFFGILQGVKRAAAPVTDDFVQSAYEKHRAALSAEPRGIAPDSDHKARYDEIFDKFRPPVEKLFEASSAASFQSKRTQGGARGFIREELEEGLISMVETRPGVVQTIYGKYAPNFREAVKLAREGSHNVMVSAVLEPLKVRLITKGDSYRYWISRFYQKAMWKYLQSFPQFVLTGRPLGSVDLINLKERERKLGLNFPKWVSGDYSAATDSLDIRHTKAAFESSLKMSLLKIHPETMDILRSVLYEQEIHYPASSGLAPVHQTTGQLMGSTLSFPILCIVNLVAYWRSLEKYLDREIDIRDLPVLVNGDDILFRADDNLYDLWQDEVKHVGFELSLGKNYIHPKYFTVNSQLYSDNENVPQHLGYLNAGLLTGQSKITGRDTAKLAPIWDYYNEIVPSSVNPLRTHDRFMHYHKSAIATFTKKGNYNLFLPFERGGLGFNPPKGLEVRVTPFQRRYATFIEKKFMEEPGKIGKIALVSEKNSSQLIMFHQPRWVIGPKIGPQPEFVERSTDREVYTPPLALEGEPSDKPKMRVRHPSHTVLRQFRKGTFRQMGGCVRTFAWQPLEQIIQQKPGETPEEFRSRTMSF
jgi:hypothetical protein